MGTTQPKIFGLPQQNASSILPFAMAVGLIVFFITGDLDGGFSDVRGFFIGVGTVIILKVLVVSSEAWRRTSDPAFLHRAIEPPPSIPLGAFSNDLLLFEVPTYKIETLTLDQQEKLTPTIDDLSRAIVKLLAAAGTPTTVTIKSFQDKKAAIIQIQTQIAQAEEENG